MLPRAAGRDSSPVQVARVLEPDPRRQVQAEGDDLVAGQVRPWRARRPGRAGFESVCRNDDLLAFLAQLVLRPGERRGLRQLADVRDREVDADEAAAVPRPVADAADLRVSATRRDPGSASSARSPRALELGIQRQTAQRDQRRHRGVDDERRRTVEAAASDPLRIRTRCPSGPPRGRCTRSSDDRHQRWRQGRAQSVSASRE